MTTEQKKFLLPLCLVFATTFIYWLFFRVPYYQFIFLFFGLSIGAFFLDIDHLVFWLYLSPNIEESRLAKIAIQKYDYKSIINLIQSTQYQHTSLIFHHFFFQVVVSLISVFVFTSSGSIFGMGFLLAINIHLLIHEIYDFQHHPTRLQDWLFAREQKQLPLNYLPAYIGLFIVLNILFFTLLLRSAT